MKKYLAIFVTVSFVICSLFTAINFFDLENNGEYAAIKPNRDDPQG
ncbi:hypothetical protein JNUCC42_21360 [Brevibacterium sp. JNUCC-42]|nr:hypothetical protein JNUCC42_21360 [Brevibacterium sp. JNUCC-42]